MTKQKRVLIVGSFCNISGYSDHARLLADALISQNSGHKFYLLDLQWAAASRDMKYVKKYGSMIQETAQYINFLKQTGQQMHQGFDCSFQVRAPNEFSRITHYDIGVTAALETVAAPSEWIEKCNAMQKLLVVSEHSKKNLQNAQDQNGATITSDIEVIPFYNNLEDISSRESFSGYEEITTSKNFLCVSQLAPRKNIINMLDWFTEEFYNDPDVGLVLKTHLINNSVPDCNHTKTQLQSFLNMNKNREDKKCKVYLLHGNLSEEQMHGLYDPNKITGYISSTHGEGFGIPMFNAVCSDIPVIAPAWSGHLDYLRASVKNPNTGRAKIQSMFMKVKHKIEPVQDHHLMPGLITEGSEWCYPEKESFKKNLRALADRPSQYQADAITLGEIVRNNFSKDAVYQKYLNVMNSIFTNVGSEDAEAKTGNSQILEL